MSGLLFLETSGFQKWVRKNRLTASVERLRAHLLLNPDAGDVIPGGGGLRKIRMAGGGRGKSGGFRIIYTLMLGREVAVFLDGYAKNEREDLSAEELAALIGQVNRIQHLAKQFVDQNKPNAEE